MADMLWRECVTWLIRCEVLPPDHRVTLPNSQVLDLANTLRDGVLLCQLLNKLVPGCIDLKEISLRPQMSQVLIYTTDSTVYIDLKIKLNTRFSVICFVIQRRSCI